MKCALPVLAALALCGCSITSAPTAPNPAAANPAQTSSTSTSLWGIVVSSGGACIEGAVVEVVRGQALGQRTLSETPCGVWDYSGGFVFKELTPGAEMTVRASAPGWSTEEATFVPRSGMQQAVVIKLEKR
jgi:hypothetical protein